MIQTELLETSEEGFARSAEMLRQGQCVAFPTETVYGLGANASDAAAVARIYAAKERPSFNPLIAHFSSAEAAIAQGRFSQDALALAAAFWPGPLTLVVPVGDQTGICDLARAGLPSVGLRVPSHPVARELLRRVNFPVAAPSANSSGHVSATSAEHVLEDLRGRVAAVLDGGPTDVGVESTIIDCTGPVLRLLRPGGISREQVEQVIRKPLGERPAPSAVPLAPGMLTSHYAPEAVVRLEASEVFPGEAVILFGPVSPPGTEQAAAIENLSPSGNLEEAAARLFAILRKLDAAGVATIAVAPIPRTGLGEAINDRLQRAAAAR